MALTLALIQNDWAATRLVIIAFFTFGLGSLYACGIDIAGGSAQPVVYVVLGLTVLFVAITGTTLFKAIKDYITSHQNGKPPRDLKKLPLYWGNVTIEEESKLLSIYENSDTWKRFWYKSLRSGPLLQFAGDAALYISRYVGAKVAQKLEQQTEQALGDLHNLSPDTGDRLHIVGHSLGTVILFDLFFSTRWQPPAPGHQYAMSLRDLVYGIEPNWRKGICLATRPL